MEKNYWELKKKLPNSKNQELINAFLLSLKLANHSKATVKGYRYFLERFFGEMEESLLHLSPASIYNWLRTHGEGQKERTHNFRLSVLSSLYNFCLDEGYLEASPIKKRWFAREPKTIPQYLEKNELAKTRQYSETAKLRDRLLIEFMLASGCRVSEVHQLNREDINLEERTAMVMGKGKKIRQVHFTEKCAVLLERYLASSPSLHQALFVTSTGKRLSVRSIQIIVKKIGQQAELQSDLFPHRFRHTFATELLAKGAELSFIAEELGHKDIQTTYIYARLPKKEIINLYRKYMG